MLDWNPKTRFDIDQVVNSRAIKKYLPRFQEPLTPEEYEMLIKNFLMNSPTGLTTDTPREVLKYACFELPPEDWINLQESFRNTGYILNKRNNNFQSFDPSPRSGNGQTFKNLQEFGRGDVGKAQAQDQTWNDFMPPALVSESSPKQLASVGSGTAPMQKQASFAKQPDNQNKKVIKIDNGGDNIWGGSSQQSPVEKNKPASQPQWTSQPAQLSQSQVTFQAQAQAPAQPQGQSWNQLQTQSAIQAPTQPKVVPSVPHQSPQPPQSPNYWNNTYAPHLPRHHFGYFEGSASQNQPAATTPSTPFAPKDLEPKVKKAPNSEPPASLNPFMAESSPRNNLTVSQASRTATDQNWDVSQAFKKVQKLETPDAKFYNPSKQFDPYKSASQPQAPPKVAEAPQTPKEAETPSSQMSGVKFVKRVFASGSFLQGSTQQPTPGVWESTSARQSPKRQAANQDARSDISVKGSATNQQSAAHSSASDSLSINTNASEQLNLTGVTSPNSKGPNRHKIDLDQKTDITRTVGAVTQPKEEPKPLAINRTSSNQPIVYKNGVLVTKTLPANGGLTADIQVIEGNKPKSDELLDSKRTPDQQPLYSSSVQSLEQYKNKFQGLPQQPSGQLARLDAPNFTPQQSSGSLQEDTVNLTPAKSPNNEELKKPSNKMFKINLSIHGQQRDPPVIDAKPEPKPAVTKEPPKQPDFRGQVAGDQSSRGYTSNYGTRGPVNEGKPAERNGQPKSNVKHFKID